MGYADSSSTRIISQYRRLFDTRPEDLSLSFHYGQRRRATGWLVTRYATPFMALIYASYVAVAKKIVRQFDVYIIVIGYGAIRRLVFRRHYNAHDNYAILVTYSPAATIV